MVEEVNVLGRENLLEGYFKCTSNNTNPSERKDDQLKKRSKHVKFKNNIFLK